MRFKYCTPDGKWCEVLGTLLDAYLLIPTKFLHDWSGDLKRHALPLHEGVFYCCSSRNTGDMMQRLHAQNVAISWSIWVTRFGGRNF